MIHLIKRKSRHLVWCTLLMSFLIGGIGVPQFQNVVHAENPSSLNPYNIEYDESELNFPYGEFRELEIHLIGGTVTSDILWENIDGELPPGLSLENTSNSNVRIFGSGKFSDRWCLAIRASSKLAFLASREICLNGTENSTVDYPHLSRKTVLPNAEAGTTYRERLLYKAKKKYTYTGEVLLQQLPKGITVKFQPKQNRFLVAGTTKKTGVFRFVTKLTDNFGKEVSQQYQFEVIPKIAHNPAPDPLPDPEPQPQPIYQCPTGYYYSPTLGYCVEDHSTSCPSGTYYDSYKNTCEPYNREASCGIGYYYDYFLERCVRQEYPRCPRNYEYSDYYGRCVRQSYTCDIGYEYDWNTRECRRSWYSRTCDNSSYWDHQLDRCVPQWGGCQAGYRWDNNSRRCERRGDSCRSGEYYDPQQGGCHRRSESCEPGSRYNYQTGRCEYNNDSNRRCPPGQHWNYQTQSCVGDNPTNPPPSRPTCVDQPQTPAACSEYAGQYGIPTNATQGRASWTKNSCSGEIKYTGGCSEPTAPKCENVKQTPVACSEYAGQYGIPTNATQGRASWTKNSCSGEIKYTGGCSEPTAPKCENVKQTPVACSEYAGQYGIPTNATQGRASWTKNSCSGDIRYTGGCSVPAAPRCEDVPQSSVSCADYAGQYGIPANATQGRASWTRNSCSGDIRYTGGCSVPAAPRCQDVPQTPVACSDYAGQYGIPANATQGRASWTQNSCTGEIRYTGGCY